MADDKLDDTLRSRQAFSTQEAELFGISRLTLSRMTREGLLVRIRQGYYAVAVKAEDGAWMDAADQMAKMAAMASDPVFSRHGRVVCLNTAAWLHGLTTTPSAELHVAVPRETTVFRKKGADQPLPVHVHRWRNPRMLEVGVTTAHMYGRDVAVTDPVRTVVDILRAARTVGDDLAAEVLQRAVDKGISKDEIAGMADRLGVAAAVRPWLIGMAVGFGAGRHYEAGHGK
jgi:predicted transcriptional regulator of viral defense system